MSPMPAIVPSTRRDVMPEMNTMVPRAAIACEKWPLGWRIRGDTICFFGIGILVAAATSSLRRSPGRPVAYRKTSRLRSMGSRAHPRPRCPRGGAFARPAPDDPAGALFAGLGAFWHMEAGGLFRVDGDVR